jgi:hypothetical protein
MPASTSATSVHVHDGGDVVLHPEDNDLFMRTGKQVIEACRLGISIEVWIDEFNNMMSEVARWAKEHAASVRSCHCVPLGPRITLFFSPQGDSYNFDLAENLAELNAELIKKFNVGMVEVRQIPFAQIDRFLDPEKARLVHGDPGAGPH